MEAAVCAVGFGDGAHAPFGTQSNELGGGAEGSGEGNTYCQYLTYL
jgi:hypothetical protein